ncbi:MAG: aspartate aminotransferase, partial [Stackebrandtia sp.]
ARWRERCDTVVEQLADYPVIRPHGGWSLLVDAKPIGLTGAGLSRLLFDKAKIAATAMDGWGPDAGRYLRLVFANEPVERLATLRDRWRTALG